MINFLKKLIIPKSVRGESAAPKGVHHTVTPDNIPMQEWIDGKWHEYFWGSMVREIKETPKNNL